MPVGKTVKQKSKKVSEANSISSSLNISESVRKGWEIMAVLVISFPPSKNFEAYLSNVIDAGTRQKELQVDIIARHCAGKLTRISKSGPRGKTPTTVEIERAMVLAYMVTVKLNLAIRRLHFTRLFLVNLFRKLCVFNELNSLN